MRHSVPVIAASLVLAVVLLSNAAAVTLLDQAPSGLPGGLFSDEGCDALLTTHGHSQTVAEGFQVVTGGAGFMLEEVVIWGGFEPWSGAGAPLWNDVDVLVHADDQGLPAPRCAPRAPCWRPARRRVRCSGRRRTTCPSIG